METIKVTSTSAKTIERLRSEEGLFEAKAMICDAFVELVSQAASNGGGDLCSTTALVLEEYVGMMEEFSKDEDSQSI